MAQVIHEPVEDDMDDFTEEDIFAEISFERDFQRKIGYTTEEDDTNTASGWGVLLSYYSHLWFYSPRKINFRTSMVKVAALAVAAIEWTDRQTGKEK